MERRSFLRRSLQQLTRALARAAENAAGEASSRVSGGQRYLRPPGALAEPAFLLTCSRCGDCGDACPSGAIRFLPDRAGAAAGTPHLDPEQAPCLHCLQCVQACSTGALAPLSDPRQIKIGVATIQADACWGHRGRVCDVCYGVCPFPDEAIQMVAGRPVINPDLCTGCGLCAYVCPATPNAIQVLPA